MLSNWKVSKIYRPSTPKLSTTPTASPPQPAVDKRMWSPCADIPEPILVCLRGPRGLEEVNAKSSLHWAVSTYPAPPEPHEPCSDPKPNTRPQTFDPKDLRAEPAWLNHFNAGAESRLSTERKESAKNLVGSLQVWTPTDLSDLVILFIRLAISCFNCSLNQDGLKALAMFAKAANDCFDTQQSGINHFREQFEKRVIGVLRCPWAMVYRVKTPDAYFLPIYNLCGFVGACIKHGMFKSTVGHRLIHLLLDQATHLEYIHGIRHILLHAEDAFWDTVGSEFARKRDVAAFKKRIQNLRAITNEANGQSLFLQVPTIAAGMDGGADEYQARKLKKARDGVSEIEKLVSKHSKPLPATPPLPGQRKII